MFVFNEHEWETLFITNYYRSVPVISFIFNMTRISLQNGMRLMIRRFFFIPVLFKRTGWALPKNQSPSCLLLWGQTNTSDVIDFQVVAATGGKKGATGARACRQRPVRVRRRLRRPRLAVSLPRVQPAGWGCGGSGDCITKVLPNW